MTKPLSYHHVSSIVKYHCVMYTQHLHVNFITCVVSVVANVAMLYYYSYSYIAVLTYIV